MTDVTMARYPTAYLQAKALRSAVFLADTFLLLHQHRRIKRDWRPLHLLRRKLFGQVRLRGFGKWLLIVATVEDRILFRNCANRGLWQIWQFFCLFSDHELSSTSRVLFVPNPFGLNLRVKFGKFIFHECLSRKVPPSGRVLTASRPMSSVSL